MKPIRNILLTVFLTIIVITAVSYSACNKNNCSNVVCQHRGVCDGGTCFCPVGYEGIRCEILSRDKFIFNYNGSDICSNRTYPHQYQIHLLATPGDSLELTMKNFIENPDDSAICTIQSVDSFSFIGSNNSTTYTGTGKLSHDSLWLYYQVIHDTSTYTCKYLGGSLR